MSNLNLENVRNIGISAHIDSGKTTLTERILYYGGRIHRINEVKGDGDGATMDYMDLERERGITITSAATKVQWGDIHVNVIDTPGHVDFTVEVERSLRVLDGAILVLCAVGGVQSQSLTVDRQMKRYGIPRIAFINKMDRTGANPQNVIKAIRDKLGITPMPLQLNMGTESRFEGVIDLVTMKAIYYDGEKGETVREEAIPEDYREAAETARHEMLETLSMFSDELMEALLEERIIEAAEIKPIIRKAVLSRNVTPVMMGTAYKNKGVQTLLDAVVDYLPSPLDREMYATDIDYRAPALAEGEVADKNANKVLLKPDNKLPLVCMAFKIIEEQFGQLTFIRLYQGQIIKGDSYTNTRTGKRTRFGRIVRMHAEDREEIDRAEAGDIVAIVGVECASGDTFCGDGVNYALESIFVPEAVIRLSIEPAKRDGADRLAKALERFRREDPTFRVFTDEETGQTIIAGMGQLHLEIYTERIKREYKVECIVGEPRVAYREYPTKSVEFNYKHKKQTGGSGQYAHIVGRLDPLDLETMTDTYVFDNKVTQGRIPKEYIAPTDFGFRKALPKGPLCECEVVGVKMTLIDGGYHDVDSSEMAFQIAGFDCMRETLKKAGIGLLEPIMKIEVEVPTEYQGTVSGHVSSKRGLINNSEVRSGVCYITAECPLAMMFDYANELRSMTQGKGGFTMEFSAYKPVPKSLVDDIVAKRKADKEARLAAK